MKLKYSPLKTDSKVVELENHQTMRAGEPVEVPDLLAERLLRDHPKRFAKAAAAKKKTEN